MVKFIHTGDWHLGCRLDSIDRRSEHQQFLEFLLEKLRDQKPNALFICGDVFDSANPPLSAQQDLFRFLLKARLVCRNIVAIAGNHDSAIRLDTLSTLLDPLDIHFVGTLPAQREDALIQILDRNQQPVAEVAAIPFLRGVDLPPPGPGESPDEAYQRMTQSISSIMNEYLELHNRGDLRDRPLIYLGHMFVAGGTTTTDSERPVQTIAGKVHSIPPEIFPTSSAYVALGHLHRKQRVKHPGSVPVLYSGSVIPMSFTEADYNHQILEVTLDDSRQNSETRCEPVIESHCVPRDLVMMDIEGSQTDITDRLHELTAQHPDPQDSVLVRIMVDLHSPAPGLRQELAKIVEGTGIKIMAVRRLDFENESMNRLLQDNQSLHDLEPREVFRLLHRLEYDSDPEDDLMTAFLELTHEIKTSKTEEN